MSDRPIRDALDRLQRGEGGDGLDLVGRRDEDQTSVGVSGQKQLSEAWSVAGAVQWAKDLGWSAVGMLRWRPKR